MAIFMKPGFVWLNNFEAEVVSAIADTDTTITISSTTEIEALPLSEPANLTGDETQDTVEIKSGVVLTLTLVGSAPPESVDDIEIIYCFAAAAGDITVLRGQEGTAAKSWDAGTIASSRLTANHLSAPGGFTKADGSLVILNIEDNERPLSYSRSVILGGAHGAVGKGSISIGGIQQAISQNVSATELPNADSFNLGAGYFPNPGAQFTGTKLINIGSGGVYGDNVDEANKSINIGSGGAGGEYAINIGEGYCGDRSINIGDGGSGVYTGARSDGAVNIGNNNGAWFARATHIGCGGDAGAEGATVVGNRAEAAALDSTALGTTAVASGANSLALGANTTVTDSDTASVGERDFVVGSGTNSRAVILYSPNGAGYRLTVDDTGALTTTEIV